MMGNSVVKFLWALCSINYLTDSSYFCKLWHVLDLIWSPILKSWTFLIKIFSRSVGRFGGMSCSASVSSGMSPSAHFLRHYTPLTTTSPISPSSSSESSLSSSLSSSSPSRSIAPYLLAKKVPDWHFDHFPQVPCSFEHLGYAIWEQP